MNGIASDMLLSLGAAYTPRNNESNALATIIQRINFERGGFNNITEDSLRQEIAEKEAALDDDGESSTDEDAEEQDDPLKKLMASKMEILQQLDMANGAAIVSLEFISLLISKDMPTQASTTLSHFTRENIGLGTLGMDKLAAPRTTPAQKQDNRQVAKGWKSQSLGKTVDSILASASRLEKEIELETKYWDQVLSVSDSGWSVCRLPHEKHTLGVRFGFLEASGNFKNRSLGALRRNGDGSISLDQGVSAPPPQAIRVRVFENGKETGTTTPPLLVPDNSLIEPVIRQARNNIFAQELWQELNREARSLYAHSVKATTEKTITLSITPTKTATIDLVPLSEFTSPFQKPGADDHIAEGVNLSLSLALTCAHRTSYRHGVQIPKPVDAQTASSKADPLPLLRPLLNRLIHQQTLHDLQSFMQALVSALQSAGLEDITWELKPAKARMPDFLSHGEKTLAHIFGQLEAEAILTLPPILPPSPSSPDQISTQEKNTITISTRTYQHFLISSFGITLSPTNPIREIAPPPIGLPQFSTVPDLREWLFWSVGCYLADSFAGSMPDEKAKATNNILRVDTSQGIKIMAFNVGKVQSDEGREGVRLRVVWENGVTAGEAGMKKPKAYDWVSWAGVKAVVDDGEVRVVVRSLREVVEGVVGRV